MTTSKIATQDLAREIGLDRLPAKEQAEVLLGIGRIIYEGVFLRVLGTLSEQDRREFEKILDAAEREEDILEFLEPRVPQLGRLVEEEVAQFKREALRFIKKVQ